MSIESRNPVFSIELWITRIFKDGVILGQEHGAPDDQRSSRNFVAPEDDVVRDDPEVSIGGRQEPEALLLASPEVLHIDHVLVGQGPMSEALYFTASQQGAVYYKNSIGS